ncbi:MAG TPA: EAL domain-containing protein [Actinophytocola sp.]|uniref:putative bifunctional diguanylate cyclase/phosphodiesterase n=1 Tax=Actinophytocola sp. TaxID=1872138 RepID=UPI002DDCCD17|nr:EAL domain-containing protein [Actinophytocola sp.]HEV2783729.1 EAL domain-containing protein [Actinophytocola sp.]
MDRAELARQWAGALTQVIYVARSRDEIEGALLGFVDRLTTLIRAGDFTADPAADLGAEMVEFGMTKPVCLRCSVDLLAAALPELPELCGVQRLPVRVAAVLGALSGGFANGMRARLFAEQEDIKRALTHAKENVERDLQASEALFREIFTSSSVGMAISDLNGSLVRTNRALADILEYPSRELAGKKLQELFHPDETEYLTLRYRELLDEDTLPFRERRKLLRKGGDEVLVYLSCSVLRHPDGTPRHYVTTVEDISDKYLLEDQLRFQATHDALTGLANRQRFISKIEEALAGKHAVESITLFHIDLDGFAAVNDGPGRHVGDRLLQVVAQRLNSVVEEESALVARLDADEFGIMIETTPSTPAAAAIAQRINDELGEPFYVADNGVATTACIAVLESPPADANPTELLQATDITLRRLKASGRRQWAMVDRELGERDRTRYNLAASIPGAWESGDIELEYQPLVSVEDRTIVAVQPLLRWDHATQGLLDHDRVIEVLEETGLSLPIGRWVLSRACEQIMSWKHRVSGDLPQLYVELNRQQAADPDLVSTVQAALLDTGMPNKQLRLGMPVQALCMIDGLAEDNLDILVDLGISVVLHEFGTTRGDLACLEDLPVGAVKMAKRVISRVTRGMDKDTLFVRAIRDLVPLVGSTDASVIVGHIETEDQLAWWRDIGAKTASGPLFGAAGPPGEIERLFV